MKAYAYIAAGCSMPMRLPSVCATPHVHLTRVAQQLTIHRYLTFEEVRYMNTRKTVRAYLITAIALMGTVCATPAQAAATNSVFVDTPVLSRCDEHVVAFSGTATYNTGTHHLLIDLDGVPVYSTFDEPMLWSFLRNVPVGTHTLTARVHDNNVSQTVHHAVTFEVPACATSDGGGSDDEPDCCPGPDPVAATQTNVRQPAVKGITSRSVQHSNLKDLAPLNRVFRSVFGRNPTFAEWEYWANRFLTDKPAWDQILGAMQWHKLRGVTTGA